MSGTCKVRHLVVLETCITKPIDSSLKHRPLGQIGDRLQQPFPPLCLKSGALFPGQAIDRHMLRLERHDCLEVSLHIRDGLAGCGGHQVEAPAHTCFGKHARRTPHIVRHMITVEYPQRRDIKRLAPQADPCHATPASSCDEGLVHIERIGLKGDLCVLDWMQRLSQHREEPFQTFATEVRGSPATEIERVDLQWLCEPSKLSLKGFEILVDQVVSAGHQREVAIAAAVPTKRNMQIYAPRQPAHSHTWSRPSSKSGIFLAMMRLIRSSV